VFESVARPLPFVLFCLSPTAPPCPRAHGAGCKNTVTGHGPRVKGAAPMLMSGHGPFSFCMTMGRLLPRNEIRFNLWKSLAWVCSDIV